MAGKHRINGNQARLFIGNLREWLPDIGLAPDDYFMMRQAYADLGIVGGAIYDAMLAVCVLKSGAATLFTWNLRHYGQFGPEVTARVKMPLSD